MKILSRISLLFLLFATAPTVMAVEDLNDGAPLPADQAFKQKLTLKDSNTVNATWAIEKKYYLYRNKFKFISKTKGVELGTITIPAGKKKKDPLFGIVQIFRDKVSIQVPIKSIDKSVRKFDIEVHSQGCADIGICYPPQKKTVSLTLAALGATAINADTTSKPVATPAATTAKVDVTSDKDKKAATKKITNFGTNLGLGQDEEYLTSEQAFKISTEYTNDNLLTVRWKIAKNYYLYKNRLKFSLKDAPANVTLGTPQIPKGKLKKDPAFGNVYVFYDFLEVKIPVKGAKKGQKIEFLAKSQGCADAGLCYPPVLKLATYVNGGLISIKDHKISYAKNPVATPANTTKPGTAGIPAKAATPVKAISPDATAEEDDRSFFEKVGDWFTQSLKDGNLLIALISMLGLGLLVAFTACMYPMIPIVCTLVIGEGENASKMRGFILSGTYVIAMAIVFGVLGGVAGSAAKELPIQAAFQSPWVLGPIVALMALLALAMFGVFNIQMPSALQNRIDSISRNQKGGSVVGAAITGGLSALVVGPCGGPFLIAALGAAATSGSFVGGFSYLFLFGLGMGLPLIFVGVYGSKCLPKAGTWMTMVKHTGGIILLGLALYFAERLTDKIPGFFMMLWAVFFIMTGIYFRALEPVPEGASGKRYIFKGFAVIIFLWGILVAIGGLTGSRIASDPFEGSSLTSGSTSVSAASTGATTNAADARKQRYLAGKKTKLKGKLKFIKIKSTDDLDKEIKQANAAGFTVMLDFYATWCTYCIQFDVYVFSKPSVGAALSNTILLQADVTANDKQDKALMKHVKIFAPPSIMFYGLDGKEVRKQRISKLVKKERFLKYVKRAFGK